MESFAFPDKIKMNILKALFGANILPYAIFFEMAFLATLSELC